MKRFLTNRSALSPRTFTAIDGLDYTWVVRHDVSPASSPPQAPVRINYHLPPSPSYLAAINSRSSGSESRLLTSFCFYLKCFHCCASPSYGRYTFVPDLCVLLQRVSYRSNLSPGACKRSFPLLWRISLVFDSLRPYSCLDFFHRRWISYLSPRQMSTEVAMMCPQRYWRSQRIQRHCSQVSPFNRELFPFSSTTHTPPLPPLPFSVFPTCPFFPRSRNGATSLI